MMQILPGWASRVPAWLLARLSAAEANGATRGPAIRSNAGSSFGTFPTATPDVRQEDPRAVAALYTSGF